MLNAAEQTLFRRLSVFVDGCTLEAAEAVGTSDGVQTVNALDGIASLVDKSLLQSDIGRGTEPRFTMLETVREYALEWLVTSGEADTIQRRHASWFLDLAEQAAPWLTSADRERWLRRLQVEHDNLQAALALSATHDDLGETTLRLAGALRWYWNLRGHWDEGRSWLRKALARSDASVSPVTNAKALEGAGMLAFVQQDLAEARPMMEDSVARWKEGGDPAGLGHALDFLGIVARDQRDFDVARSAHEVSAALFRECGDDWGLAFSLNCLGNVARDQRDLVAARMAYDAALPLWKALGDIWGLALTRGNLGSLAYLHGELATARTLYEESLELRRQVGDQFLIEFQLARLATLTQQMGNYDRAKDLLDEKLTLDRKTGRKTSIAWSLRNLGRVELALGHGEQSSALLKESLHLSQQQGVRLEIILCLAALAHAAAAQGRSGDASRLLGAVETISFEARVFEDVPEDVVRGYQTDVDAARALLGEPAAGVAWTQGQGLTLTQAAALALGDDDGT